MAFMTRSVGFVTGRVTLMRNLMLAAGAASIAILAAAAAEAQKRPSRDGYLFSYADRDGDGVLTPAEFGIILYPGGNPDRALRDLPPQDMARFAEADVDGSGGLTLEEFSAWFARRK